ncbi:MAG TPA: hypothetical protein VFA45_10875 [Actinomycetes bacterium]|jgi:hypothetical protein|nr:hypothetical protein [Actinomycetes bacterium]
MTSEPALDIPLHEVALVPERTLGSPAVHEALEGRLTFGWDVLPVKPGATRPGWHSYTEAVAGRSFCQLLMVCSFRPEQPDARGAFVRASLGISLHTDNPTSSSPLARLIEPGERTRPVSATGSGLRFTVKAGVVDLGVERQPSAATTREEWIVRGYGASQATPTWEFRRLKQYPLVGDHPVAALIELVPGHHNRAEVMLVAEVEHTTWGVRRYKARLNPAQSAIDLLMAGDRP